MANPKFARRTLPLAINTYYIFIWNFQTFVCTHFQTLKMLNFDLFYCQLLNCSNVQTFKLSGNIILLRSCVLSVVCIMAAAASRISALGRKHTHTLCLRAARSHTLKVCKFEVLKVWTVILNFAIDGFKLFKLCHFSNFQTFKSLKGSSNSNIAPPSNFESFTVW